MELGTDMHQSLDLQAQSRRTTKTFPHPPDLVAHDISIRYATSRWGGRITGWGRHGKSNESEREAPCGPRAREQADGRVGRLLVVVSVVMGACPGVSASRLMGAELAPLYARPECQPQATTSRRPNFCHGAQSLSFNVQKRS